MEVSAASGKVHMGKNGAGKLLYFFAVFFITFSLLFIMVNATLIFAGFGYVNLLFSSVVALAAGMLSWISARKIRKCFLFLFSAVFCFQTFFLFFFSAVSPVKMSSGIFWPVLVLFCGISFFAAGVMKKKRILNFYTVVSGGFLILGGIFLLFSSEIIPFSFSSMFVYCFPVFILIFIAVVSAFVSFRMERIKNTAEQGGTAEEKSVRCDSRQEWL